MVYKHTGDAAGKSEKLPCPGVKFLKMMPFPTIVCQSGHVLEFLRVKLSNGFKISRNLLENAEILPPKRFKSYSRSADGLQGRSGVSNEKYGPRHGANNYTNMIPCPCVRILEMIPCSVARPGTENYISNLPPFTYVFIKKKR